MHEMVRVLQMQETMMDDMMGERGTSMINGNATCNNEIYKYIGVK